MTEISPHRQQAVPRIGLVFDKLNARSPIYPDHCRAKAFHAAYGAKCPKAAAKVVDDVEELLTFYDYPAEHWIHLRTTNPIESTLECLPGGVERTDRSAQSGFGRVT